MDSANNKIPMTIIPAPPPNLPSSTGYVNDTTPGIKPGKVYLTRAQRKPVPKWRNNFFLRTYQRTVYTICIIVLIIGFVVIVAVLKSMGRI